MVDIPIPGTRPEAPQYQSRVFIGDRAELPKDDKGRRIALDFNSADNPTPGVEIIVPEDITDEELEASKAYVEGVAKLFDKHGYGGYGIRSSDFHPGVKRRGIENDSGISNTFHTEPFFMQDEKARAIFMMPEFQQDYTQLLSDTLRTIPDSVIMAPHKKGAEGAAFEQDGETVTERSLGMSLVRQIAPEQEPTSEAEIESQQGDVFSRILLAALDEPVSLNDNTSANDSIGAQMAAMASSQQPSTRMGLGQALAPSFAGTGTMTLDIDTSPEEAQRRIDEERKSPAYSMDALIHAAMTGQQFGAADYDPGAKVILRY